MIPGPGPWSEGGIVAKTGLKRAVLIGQLDLRQSLDWLKNGAGLGLDMLERWKRNFWVQFLDYYQVKVRESIKKKNTIFYDLVSNSFVNYPPT